ncbi:hypothetical protein AAG570_002735 [Ranatra chinensis]|uniref:Uncharacterized protein n=1 Tax=Ranatra chinensis TaxID=642074 RepID=A0ABD0YWV5_9HEMI
MASKLRNMFHKNKKYPRVSAASRYELWTQQFFSMNDSGLQAQEDAPYYSNKFGGRYTAEGESLRLDLNLLAPAWTYRVILKGEGIPYLDFRFDEPSSRESTRGVASDREILPIKQQYNAGVKGGHRAHPKWQAYPAWKTTESDTFGEEYRRQDQGRKPYPYARPADETPASIFERNNYRNPDSMGIDYGSSSTSYHSGYRTEETTPTRSQDETRASTPYYGEMSSPQQRETTVHRGPGEDLLPVRFLGHNPGHSTSNPAYNPTTHRFAPERTSAEDGHDVHKHSRVMTYSYEMAGGERDTMPQEGIQIVGHLPNYRPSETEQSTAANNSADHKVQTYKECNTGNCTAEESTPPKESEWGNPAGSNRTEEVPTERYPQEQVYQSTKVTPLCHRNKKTKDGQEGGKDLAEATQYLNCDGDVNTSVENEHQNKTKPHDEPKNTDDFDGMTDEMKDKYFKELEAQIVKEETFNSSYGIDTKETDAGNKTFAYQGSEQPIDSKIENTNTLNYTSNEGSGPVLTYSEPQNSQYDSIEKTQSDIIVQENNHTRSSESVQRQDIREFHKGTDQIQITELIDQPRGNGTAQQSDESAQTGVTQTEKKKQNASSSDSAVDGLSKIYKQVDSSLEDEPDINKSQYGADNKYYFISKPEDSNKQAVAIRGQEAQSSWWDNGMMLLRREPAQESLETSNGTSEISNTRGGLQKSEPELNLTSANDKIPERISLHDLTVASISSSGSQHRAEYPNTDGQEQRPPIVNNSDASPENVSNHQRVGHGQENVDVAPVFIREEAYLTRSDQNRGYIDNGKQSEVRPLDTRTEQNQSTPETANREIESQVVQKIPTSQSRGEEEIVAQTGTREGNNHGNFQNESNSQETVNIDKSEETLRSWLTQLMDMSKHSGQDGNQNVQGTVNFSAGTTDGHKQSDVAFGRPADVEPTYQVQNIDKAVTSTNQQTDRQNEGQQKVSEATRDPDFVNQKVETFQLEEKVEPDAQTTETPKRPDVENQKVESFHPQGIIKPEVPTAETDRGSDLENQKVEPLHPRENIKPDVQITEKDRGSDYENQKVETLQPQEKINPEVQTIEKDKGSDFENHKVEPFQTEENIKPDVQITETVKGPDFENQKVEPFQLQEKIEPDVQKTETAGSLEFENQKVEPMQPQENIKPDIQITETARSSDFENQKVEPIQLQEKIKPNIQITETTRGSDFVNQKVEPFQLQEHIKPDIQITETPGGSDFENQKVEPFELQEKIKKDVQITETPGGSDFVNQKLEPFQLQEKIKPDVQITETPGGSDFENQKVEPFQLQEKIKPDVQITETPGGSDFENQKLEPFQLQEKIKPDVQITETPGGSNFENQKVEPFQLQEKIKPDVQITETPGGSDFANQKVEPFQLQEKIKPDVQITETPGGSDFENQKVEPFQLQEKIKPYSENGQEGVQFQVPKEWDRDDTEENQEVQKPTGIDFSQNEERKNLSLNSLSGARSQDSTGRQRGDEESDADESSTPVVSVVTEISVHRTSENTEKKQSPETEGFFTQAGRAITDYFSKPWEYVKSVFTHRVDDQCLCLCLCLLESDLFECLLLWDGNGGDVDDSDLLRLWDCEDGGDCVLRLRLRPRLGEGLRLEWAGLPSALDPRLFPPPLPLLGEPFLLLLSGDSLRGDRDDLRDFRAENGLRLLDLKKKKLFNIQMSGFVRAVGKRQPVK